MPGQTNGEKAYASRRKGTVPFLGWQARSTNGDIVYRCKKSRMWP